MEAVREKKRTKKGKPKAIVASPIIVKSAELEKPKPPESHKEEDEVHEPEVEHDDKNTEHRSSECSSAVITEGECKTVIEGETKEESATPAVIIPSAPCYEDLRNSVAEEFGRTDMMMENHLPSAPELCDLDFYQIQQINRVILNEIQQINSRTAPSRIIVKFEPFTEAEMNQYYFNPKLGMVLSFEILAKKHFVDQFDQMRKSHLYNELEKYYKLHKGIHGYEQDIVQLRDSFPKVRSRIWTVSETSQKFSHICRNGSACGGTTVRFLWGTYNKNWAKSFEDSLVQYASLCCHLLRGQNILRDIQVLTISTLIQEIVDRNLGSPQRDELRVTLTTLFHFAAKKTVTKDFKENLTNWLERIMVLFNQCSLLDDQLFLLSHILRCPTQAALQVIKTMNVARKVDHESIDDCLALLWFALRPIQDWHDKSRVLEQKAEKETQWEIVDSDGEDATEDGDQFKCPNEMIFLGILNRIPWRGIFERTLNLQAMDDQVHLSAHNLLKLVIFSSAFVNILTEGLRNYQKEKYKTFLKKLAALVKWNADLVTSLYDLYRSGDYPKDEMVVGRIATEYNIFMIRVCDHLVKNTSVLQYLSQLNYHHLDENTYWKLNYYLLTEFPDDPSRDFHEDFRRKMRDEFKFSSSQCTISQWSSVELYYILETMSALLLGCGSTDSEFLSRGVRALFYIGYVSEARESSYKGVRDLLMTIIGKHPFVIEMVLEEIQSNLQLVSTQALYMLKVLPYDDWRPTMDTVDIIGDMLENFALDSVQHNIGKLLVSYMNWALDEDGQLALGYEYHCKVAMLVLLASFKKFPRTETYKKVSLGTVEQDPEKRYIAWAWKMMTKLRLHSLDQNAMARVQKVENNAVRVIPFMKMDFLPSLKRLVEVEKNPLAMYASLLMCDHGNETGQILNTGLPMLYELLNSAPNTIIIRCLELIVPLFLNCPDLLLKNDNFTRIVEELLMAEKGLLGFQLSWKPNKVIEQLVEMIVNQILDYHSHGGDFVQKITWIWIMVLTTNSNWHSNNNYLFVIEHVLEVSATIPNLFEKSLDYFYPLILELKMKQQRRISLVPKGATFPWCSLLFTELEFICYEKVSRIWTRLVDRVSVSEEVNVTTALKEITQDFGPSELSVFKWADLLLKLDRDSSVFFLALHRYASFAEHGGKILRHNVGLVGKVQLHLRTGAKMNEEKVLKETDPEKKEIYQNAQRAFQYVANIGTTNTRPVEGNSQPALRLDLIPLELKALRRSQKQIASHWRLVTFRQDVKRRSTPSKMFDLAGVSLKEKRMRIIEAVKSSSDPAPFVVPSVDFCVEDIIRTSEKKDVYKLLMALVNDSEEMFALVSKQSSLEFQVYIENLINRYIFYNCKNCGTVDILVRYTELIRSNVNGDANMDLLMSYNVNDFVVRDEKLVQYLFHLLRWFRKSADKCQDNDHSTCLNVLKAGLYYMTTVKEEIAGKLAFTETIRDEIAKGISILLRRHPGQYEVLWRSALANAYWASSIIGIISRNELENATYFKLIRFIMGHTPTTHWKLAEMALLQLKVTDRMLSNGMTESYRMLIIEEIAKNCNACKGTPFSEFLANQLVIMFLQQNTLMVPIFTASSPFLCRLIIALFKEIKLIDDSISSCSQLANFELPKDRVQLVEHLFTYEHLKILAQYIGQLKSVCKCKYVPFLEFLSYLLIRRNTNDALPILHETITQLYSRFLDQDGIKGFFKSIRCIPEVKYLPLQFHWYLNMIQTLSRENREVLALEMRQLPWQYFIPQADDLGKMSRVLSTLNGADQEVTNMKQTVVAHVIVKTNWTAIIERRLLDFGNANNVSWLFYLAVRVPYELVKTQTDEVLRFFEGIDEFQWPLVCEKAYEDALNWMVLSYSQFPLIPPLGLSGKSPELAIFNLLLKSAQVIDAKALLLPMRANDHLAIAKKRRLTAAMIRMFGMCSMGDDGNGARAALKLFIVRMTNHFVQGESRTTSSEELVLFQTELMKLLDDRAICRTFLCGLQEHVDQSDNEQVITAYLMSIVGVAEVTKTRARLGENIVRNYFSKCIAEDRSPWQTIEKMSLSFVLKLRLDYLKDMSLLLLLHLFITCKLKMCENISLKISFLDNIVDWLPSIKFNEENKVYLLLLWTQAVCNAEQIYADGGGSLLLEKILKYLKSMSATRAQGWGSALFNAIGMAKRDRHELCVNYIIFLIVKTFPELRECSSEASTKLAQQFVADINAEKKWNFQLQADVLRELVVPERGEFSSTLVGFISSIYRAVGSDWFKKVHDFWKF